jgi:hypothetical protein|nr:MAG TPA: hypothetical protein [Caudoviricetes sp.]
MEKLIKKCQAYLRKKKIETVKKDNQIKVTKIVTSIFDEKTPKQAIQMFKEIESELNSRLDKELAKSLEAVTEIGKFKNIE